VDYIQLVLYSDQQISVSEKFIVELPKCTFMRT